MNVNPQHPDKSSASDPQDEQLAMILAEATDRAMRGEFVDIDSYCEDNPAIATELRQLFATSCVADLAGGKTATFPRQPSRTTDVLELPTTFGDYQLLEEIGRGGMGVVYKAEQTSLNRIVAIKMILQGQFASEQDLRRFQSEAEATARLTHPHIVPVYEVGDYQGRAFFCMKFVHGQTLTERMASGLIDKREAAQILAKVSRAIHYAHQQGVLHRDLKPSNILIDESGEPHVSDFGLAKHFQRKSTDTKTGAVVGTPAYMSPEQAIGQRGTVGPISDVYGLGSILYHMLVGRPPFVAASAVDTVLMVLEQEPIPPRTLSRNVDRSLEMIAMKCLQKPQDLRYESAEKLADDVDAYLNDEPIHAASGQFSQIVSRLFRDSHHADILENWGILWMWHSAVLLLLCYATEVMQWYDVQARWRYTLLWTAGLGAWAAVFWMLRRRTGPVTFVERQIAHVWAASMIGIAALFPLEYWLKLPVLTLSPMLGVINGMSFLIKAGILTGTFYLQAGALFLTAIAMAIFPEWSHIIFGVVSAACFFFPGLKYYRKSKLDH